MARRPRAIEPNLVYHVYNRRTDRQCLFASPRDYDRFQLLLEQGRRRYDVRHCAYCLMRTHWHLALWPNDPASMGAYLRWLGTIHAIRFRIDSGTRGDGHVYQDRYKAKAARDCFQYFTLIRYIEANPREAGLVSHAKDWRWSSLRERGLGSGKLIDEGPWELPFDWPTIVNTPGPVLWSAVAVNRPDPTPDP